MRIAAIVKATTGLYVVKPSKPKLIFFVTLSGAIVFGRVFGA